MATSSSSSKVLLLAVVALIYCPSGGRGNGTGENIYTHFS